MRRYQKEKEKRATLLAMQQALVGKLFCTDDSTVKILGVDYKDEYYHIRWSYHEPSTDAFYTPRFTEWVATTFGVPYYSIDLGENFFP